MCLGIPGKIIAISDPATLTAKADVCGVQRPVSLACIVSDEYPLESCIGEWVLIHVGFAMSRIDETEAAKTLQILTELGEIEEELDAMRLSAANS